VSLVKRSKFAKYIEPLTYYFKLVLAIMCIIINISLIVQLFGCQVLSSGDDEHCSYEFLSTIIDALSRQSVGLGFVSTAIFLLFSVYLLFCAFYGNQKLGIRFVIYTYCPVSPKETFFNNICYNVFL